MTDPISSLEHEFSLDAAHMTKRAITAVKTALAVTGAAAVVLGIVLLVWPDRTLNILAVFLGLYFVVSGALRLGVGIITRGMRGGSRALNIILGVLVILVGIVAVRNVATASVALLIFAVTFIGVGWIIEGVMALAEAGRHKHSGWSIAFGALSILSGAIVLLLPATSAVVLIIYAAVALVVLGILGVVRAVTFGRGTSIDATARDSAS